MSATNHKVFLIVLPYTTMYVLRDKIDIHKNF